jgi:hypothetical protein
MARPNMMRLSRLSRCARKTTAAQIASVRCVVSRCNTKQYHIALMASLNPHSHFFHSRAYSGPYCGPEFFLQHTNVTTHSANIANHFSCAQTMVKFDAKILKYMSPDEFRVLTSVEMGMRNVSSRPLLETRTAVLNSDLCCCSTKWYRHASWSAFLGSKRGWLANASKTSPATRHAATTPPHTKRAAADTNLAPAAHLPRQQEVRWLRSDLQRVRLPRAQGAGEKGIHRLDWEPDWLRKRIR